MNALSLFLRVAAPTLLLTLSAASAFAAPAPTIDPQALALLQKVQTATQNTRSLTANFVIIIRRYHNPERDFRQVGTVRIMKPNHLYQQDWIAEKNKKSGLWQKQGDSMITASDGKTIWGVMFGGEYHKADAKLLGNNPLVADEMPTFDFFGPSVLAQVQKQQEKGQLIGLTDAGTEVWEGHIYRLVDWEYKPDYPFDA